MTASSNGADVLPAFPLSAIVGQEELVEALLINAVTSDVGGVLIRGDRGTAKTTAVRALASLLAPAPLVELPLGATLDRLIGSLDLGRAMSGEHVTESGLMAQADGGILYVDEVNLLADHLVDALLDAAATGIIRVEREAISMVEAARFMLVGTMNPEEGELRPQLLDRFGLGIEVTTPTDPAVRAEIVRRRLAFELDPIAFIDRFRDQDQALTRRITSARAHLDAVVLPERELLRITGACAQLGVDGVRGDIITARAARALAALDGADEVTEEHVRRAATLALSHRRRRDPLDHHGGDEEELRRALDLDDPGDPPDDDPPSGGAPGPSPDAAPDSADGASSQSDGSPTFPPHGQARERNDAPISAGLPPAAVLLPGRGRGPLGRRARGSGRQTGAIDSRQANLDVDDLAVVATLRARLLGPDPQALRMHVRSGREATFLCLVVDASGSMGARLRAARVKGALLELLRDAYAKRDRVAVVAFRDAAATVVVAPGAPFERAATAIRRLPTGGRTPLAAGLRLAAELIMRERARDPSRRSLAVVLTDGRVADGDGAVMRAAQSLGRVAGAVSVIDTEDGPVRLGLAGQVAAGAGGTVHPLTPAPNLRRAA